MKGFGNMNNDSVVKLSSKSKLVEGYKSEMSVRHFHSFHMDEPEELGGTDSAPNPMEYVLSSLAGCESVMIKMIAKELEIDVTSLEIETVGEIDIRGLQGVEGVNPHFQSVQQKLTFGISSGKEKVDQLLDEVKRRCPAYNLIKDAGVPIEMEHQVH
ncbi:MAG: OsmC family protein [Bacillus sp. (in: Bacteria)]|nr:OsmC family protein [Bacillus sp. (in: firmicutes)]